VLAWDVNTRTPGAGKSPRPGPRGELDASGGAPRRGSGHPALAAFLCATGRKVLVEASPRDRIWGIGMGAGHPDAIRPSRWRGSNLLGFALMNVRDQL
jgi:ribA/ribD-fused uncharacterized protein